MSQLEERIRKIEEMERRRKESEQAAAFARNAYIRERSIERKAITPAPRPSWWRWPEWLAAIF